VQGEDLNNPFPFEIHFILIFNLWSFFDSPQRKFKALKLNP